MDQSKTGSQWESEEVWWVYINSGKQSVHKFIWKDRSYGLYCLNGKCFYTCALTLSWSLTHLSVINKVETCVKEKERLKNSMCALEESLKSYDVECKASRETVKRLATDVEHEQKLSASRVNELNSVRQVQNHNNTSNKIINTKYALFSLCMNIDFFL